MASVVFMRGANVGGHRKFRPAELAKQLARLDVVNIGAAGTFVVRKPVTQAQIRSEVARRLPFEPELMVCGARALIELAISDPFPSSTKSKDLRRAVSVLAKRPPAPPELPLCRPVDGPWKVELLELRGRFALSVWRRIDARLLYPNEVVERELGVPATTRSWETIGKIHEIVRAG